MSKKNNNLDPNKQVIKESIMVNYDFETIFLSRSGVVQEGSFTINNDLSHTGPTLYDHLIEIWKSNAPYYTPKYEDIDQTSILGLEIERETHWDEADDYTVMVVRLESQEEVDKRIKNEKSRIAGAKKAAATRAKKAKELEEKKKEKEYQDYLKLKKRYEE